jgi:hypothetical protein
MGEDVRLKTSMRGALVIRTQCLPVLDVSNSDSMQIFPGFHRVSIKVEHRLVERYLPARTVGRVDYVIGVMNLWNRRFPSFLSRNFKRQLRMAHNTPKVAHNAPKIISTTEISASEAR